MFGGHSSQTGYNNYSVNLSLTSSGSVSNKIEYETALRWIEWLGLENGYCKSNDDVRDVIKPGVHLYWSIPKSQLGLYVAGYYFFGKSFKFRFKQLEICSDILFSNSPVTPIMTLPSFGKTMLITLPILVLKQHVDKKCVSFLMSPYIVLVRNMVQRLGSKLRVGLVKSLFGLSNERLRKGLCNEDLMDVYCGSYNDFGSPAFQDLVSNWVFYFSDTVLSYLVIDEAHNLITERYFRLEVFDPLWRATVPALWKLFYYLEPFSKNAIKESLKVLISWSP